MILVVCCAGVGFGAIPPNPGYSVILILSKCIQSSVPAGQEGVRRDGHADGHAPEDLWGVWCLNAAAAGSEVVTRSPKRHRTSRGVAG